MNTISPVQMELELRELRIKLLCEDLFKYLFSDDNFEIDDEKYDGLITSNNQYKFDDEESENIKRFKCF